MAVMAAGPHCLGFKLSSTVSPIPELTCCCNGPVWNAPRALVVRPFSPSDVATAAAALFVLLVAVAVAHAAVQALEKLDRSEMAQLPNKQGPPARAMPACIIGAHWHARSSAGHPLKDTASE